MIRPTPSTVECHQTDDKHDDRRRGARGGWSAMVRAAAQTEWDHGVTGGLGCVAWARHDRLQQLVKH
jgi:hypothetical protein